MTPPAPHGSLHCDSAGFIQPIVTAVHRVTADRLRALRRTQVLFRDAALTTEAWRRHDAKVREYDEQLCHLESTSAETREESPEPQSSEAKPAFSNPPTSGKSTAPTASFTSEPSRVLLELPTAVCAATAVAS